MSAIFWNKTKSSYEMIFFLLVLHFCSFALATYRLPHRGHIIPSRRIKFWNEFPRRKAILLSINSRPVKPQQEHGTPFRDHNLPPTFKFPIRSDFTIKGNEDFSKVTMELPIYKAYEFNKHTSKLSLHQRENNHWVSPAVDHTTYYSPSKPYEPPTKPSDEYGPPRKPFKTYEIPAKPAEVYGPPLKLVETYRPPLKPAEVYGPPNKLCETYELPIKPAEEYGPPRKPFKTYEVPAKPAEVYGLPSRPAETYGPPIKPAVTYGPPKNSYEVHEFRGDLAKVQGPPEEICENYEGLEIFSPIDVRMDYKTDFSLPVRSHVDFKKHPYWFVPRNENWQTSPWENDRNQQAPVHLPLLDGINFDMPSLFNENNYLAKKSKETTKIFSTPPKIHLENHEDYW